MRFVVAPLTLACLPRVFGEVDAAGGSDAAGALAAGGVSTVLTLALRLP